MAMSSEFGAFFREVREGLGLSLREFCRRTGFDQGNVSRLERGLLPPPKSEKVLTAYAKGLKLKLNSPEWERFMTLAKPPAKSRRGQGHHNWVRAKQLEDWAGRLDARSTLPQLIRRLIRATGKLFRFPPQAPAGDQTQRPGWDVLVDASGDAEFVPQGVSGWELGVEKNAKKKADEDFAKRKPNRKSTFVFVTPRKYQKKAEWVEEKTKLKCWKEVRFYDSADLEEWLECAPAVDIWLARLLGLCPTGLIDVDEHWKNLQALTDPSLQPEVYLASREKQVVELKEWLAGPPDTLAIESRSPAEAVDFIVAASRRPEFGEAFVARALIVETRDAWRSLAGGDARLILVVDPALAIEAELVVEAVRNGHHVIVCASEPPVAQCKRIELRRVSGLELQKALEAQGVERTRAEDLATTAGGSIAVLKRRIARHPGTVHPQWSRLPHAREVVPLLLAGRWSDDSEGDRLALGKLADAPYRDVPALAERWSGSPDPLLTRALSRWQLVSRDDSWALLSHALNDDDLRRFKQVSLEVLGEPDPACDLPSSERWKANILGKVRTHSGLLRSGLAESLALLGARPPDHKPLSLDPRGLATYAVRSLLDDKDWKGWASLSSELPLLAEAAPDAFLSALEKDLSKRSPAVVKLFDSDASPVFGPNLHTGLLFALEGLAWDSKLLPRVTHLLARLHEGVPSTKLGNSPMRTLEQVFMPWYPQTMAPLEERVKILESVAKKHPKAGWSLLLGLLPTRPSMVSTNRRPTFRNWALQWSEGAPRADYAFQVEACSHLVVELAGEDAVRLKEVIEAFGNLPQAAWTKLLERLSSIAVSELKMDDRRVLAEAVRQKVNWYRRFPTDWALKGPALEELDRVRMRLEPDDAVVRNAWLFDDYWKVRALFERRGGDIEDADRAVGQLRATALEEVRSERKWDGVLALAEAAASPFEVGWAVGVSAAEEDDARVLPTLLTDTGGGLAEFAKGYVGARLNRQGWDWVNQLALDRWSDNQIVEFALAPQRSEPEAWDLVAKRGGDTEEMYWRKVQTFSWSKTPADVVRACTMLVKVGRPVTAVQQLGIARHREVEIDPEVIVQVLESAHDALSGSDQQARLEHVRYDIGVLIQELQNLAQAGDGRVDVDTVAALEWKYLALLDGHIATPKILYTWLEQKPRFVIELLKIIFRRSDEPAGERPEPSENERAMGGQAYRLLNSWQRVPGSRADGTVDADALRRWVNSVQTLADKEARREVADLRIGNVFAFAPREPDGTWPCIAVRDAIEEFGSEDLTEGFVLGIMNKRDAYWKAPDEGGDQERKLAKDIFDWSEAVKIEWPKTAAALCRVGEQYEADARREDAEAESR